MLKVGDPGQRLLKLRAQPYGSKKPVFQPHQSDVLALARHQALPPNNGDLAVWDFLYPINVGDTGPLQEPVKRRPPVPIKTHRVDVVRDIVCLAEIAPGKWSLLR